MFGCIGYGDNSSGLVTVSGSGTSWSNNSSLYVGAYGHGTLSVTGGACVSGSGYIGFGSGSTGIATVSGSGSTWNNGTLCVGDNGSGTLSISNGGLVAANGGTVVGSGPGSAGTINFGPNGGTLSTQSLSASPAQLTGSGTIYASGLVSDVDLLFDVTHTLKPTLTFPNAGQTVTLNLDLGSNPSRNGILAPAFKASAL